MILHSGVWLIVYHPVFHPSQKLSARVHPSQATSTKFPPISCIISNHTNCWREIHFGKKNGVGVFTHLEILGEILKAKTIWRWVTWNIEATVGVRVRLFFLARIQHGSCRKKVKVNEWSVCKQNRIERWTLDLQTTRKLNGLIGLSSIMAIETSFSTISSNGVGPFFFCHCSCHCCNSNILTL